MNRPGILVLAFLAVSSAACAGLQQKVDSAVDQLLNVQPSSTSSEENAVDPDTLVLQAADAINSRDYAAAITALETLKAHPEHDYYWATFAEAYLDNRLGRYDEALSLVNSLSPGPFHTDLLKLRAEIYFNTHRLDQAAGDLETIALGGMGPDSLVLYMLWSVDMEEGKVDRIREIEAQLEGRGSLDENDMFALCERAILRRDFVTANQALDRLPNLPSTIDNPLSSFYDPSVLMSRARIFFEQGETERALEILSGIRDEYPRVTSGYPVAAEYALTLGRFDDARNEAIEGIVQSGGRDYLTQLGISVLQMPTNADSPQGPLRRCEVADLLVVVGRTALATGGVDEAIRCAEKALELNPYQVGACILKSIALETQNDVAGAIGAVALGMRLAPCNDEAAVRYVTLAKRAPHAVGPADPDWERVLEELLERTRGVHELYPDDPGGAYVLARALSLAGDESSNELLHRAHEASPFRWDIALDYAASDAERGDVERARRILQNFRIPIDLAALVELENRVGETGSEGLAEFLSWLRSEMDPEGRFSPVLDTR